MGSVTVTWNGRTIAAADPAPIAGLDPALSIATVRRVERAAGAVRRAGDLTVGPIEVSARLLLQSEGLASSAIEGLRAPVVDVVAADLQSDPGTVAGWVSDNLAVVAGALADPGPVDAASVCKWHRRLMRHAPNIDAAHVGAWRDRLGWIGGANPLVAAHVAVPADRIDAAMQDLFLFMHRSDLDPVTQAAIAHAQFETIHPFADGNGRIGRVLIGWVLARRIGVAVPPPVSIEFARDIGGYLSGLVLFGDGAIDSWVSWFAAALERSAGSAEVVLDAVTEIRAEWAALVSERRAGSAARRLVDVLVAHPVLSTQAAAELLGVSAQAARNGLKDLANYGIVATVAGPARIGRPQWWMAPALLDVLP